MHGVPAQLPAATWAACTAAGTLTPPRPVGCRWRPHAQPTTQFWQPRWDCRKPRNRASTSGLVCPGPLCVGENPPGRPNRDAGRPEQRGLGAIRRTPRSARRRGTLSGVSQGGAHAGYDGRLPTATGSLQSPDGCHPVTTTPETTKPQPRPAVRRTAETPCSATGNGGTPTRRVPPFESRPPGT